MTTRAQSRRPPPLVLAMVLAFVVAFAFAAPALLAISHALVEVDESRITRAMVASFAGVSLPVVGAAIAAMYFGIGTRSRSRADALVAAGLDPRRAVMVPLLSAIVAAASASALVGAVVIVVVRTHFHVGSGGVIATDVLATAWALVLGAALWTSIASALIARSGRAGRGFLAVGFDLASRLLPGGVAWLAPSSHVANLLGAAPPQGIVHVPVLAQGSSVLVLATLTLVATGLSAIRYRGRP